MKGLVLVVLIALFFQTLFMPTASAAEEWSISTTKEAIFVGDPINITITGPPGNTTTVEIRIIDSNASVVSQYFALFSNGQATYNYSTDIDDPIGLWYIALGVNGEIVIRKELPVIYDDVQYLLRRQAFLEERQEKQQGFIDSLLSDNRQLRSELTTFEYALTALILLLVALCYFAFVTSWTMRTFLVELQKALGGQGVKYWWEKFIVWLVAPDSTSELRQYHLRMRLLKPPRWPAKALARRTMLWGMENGHEPIRHFGTASPTPVPAGPRPGSVGAAKVKIKKIVKKKED